MTCILCGKEFQNGEVFVASFKEDISGDGIIDYTECLDCLESYNSDKSNKVKKDRRWLVLKRNLNEYEIGESGSIPDPAPNNLN